MDCKMDQDKENVKRMARLPTPLAPLPALPHHLPNKLSDRPPLNTLAGPNGHNLKEPTGFDSNTQGFAGPSNSRRQRLIASPVRIDTRFVTMRRGFGYFLPYQDEEIRNSEPSVICISSDGDDEEDTDKDGKRRISPSTPALYTLRLAKVKNIKRSLKRPHGIELQGITPLGNREKGDGRAKRRLAFNQTVRERMQSTDFYMEREYLSDIFSYLLQVETKPLSLPRIESVTRARVINLLMKINGVAGNPATIQTAVWYLDAVHTSGDVTLENMQLVAAASYWIAAKIHGPRTPASRLVKFANNAFTKQRLLAAEAVIMVRLKFPRQPVIPQEYLYYFAWWCSRERPGEIEVAATYLCLCGMMVNKSLCTEYPSVVAAASIMNALLLLRKTKLIPKLRECSAYVAAEKKARKLSRTCAILRHAVRMVASKDYSHKFIFEQYGVPPMFIAQTVANEAYKLEVADTRSADILNRKMYIPSEWLAQLNE